MTAFPIVAVDVGNARMKLGLFRSDFGNDLPKPDRMTELTEDANDLRRLDAWLTSAGKMSTGATSAVADLPGKRLSWFIGSVNRPVASRLIDWLRSNRPDDRVTLLAAGDLPLEVHLDRPDMVGIDRLLDGLAADHLREPGRAAIVVDVGTAVTVDLISADGAFLGGSILPGLQMAARALHEFTDLLPRLDMTRLSTPPPALGTATIPAMQSGLFWGTVGAIRQLVERLALESGAKAQVFLTGGAAANIARLLGPSARHVPQLTLAGIALAARACDEKG